MTTDNFPLFRLFNVQKTSPVFWQAQVGPLSRIIRRDRRDVQEYLQSLFIMFNSIEIVLISKQNVAWAVSLRFSLVGEFTPLRFN